MPSVDNAADGLFDGLFCERASKSSMSLTTEGQMEQIASHRLFFFTSFLFKSLQSVSAKSVKKLFHITLSYHVIIHPDAFSF